MNILSAEQDNIDLMLTQLGAKVQSIHGIICSVHFNINGTEIFYVYNVNSKGQFYLQKILPYHVGSGEFDKPSEIVDYIKEDIAYYKNASKSNSFKDFVNINLELHNTMLKMEDTYLKFNVPHDKMNNIMEEIITIEKTLDEIQQTAEKIK